MLATGLDNSRGLPITRGTQIAIRAVDNGVTLTAPVVSATSPLVEPTGPATRNHIADVSDRGTEAGTGRVLRSHVKD